jgi:dipeptidyl-peptidase-4
VTRPFEALTIEQVARFPRPGMVVPSRLGFTPDSTAVTYLFSEEGSLVLSLWRYDIAAGRRRALAGPPPASTDERRLSLDEELKRERARLREVGVTSYQFAREASPQVLLVPGGGRLYVGIGDEAPREVPGAQGASDPALDNQGSRIAFVRDGDLHVVDVSGANLRRLTEGAEDGLTNGLAEFIAQEELDRDRGFWWSDDGRQIAYVRADSRHIPDYPIVHQGRDTVEVEGHRYPFAGKPNSFVQLGVVPVEGGATTWMDLGPNPDIYLARVAWRPDGVLTAQVLSRDQRTLRLLAFDAATGQARLLLEEHGHPWINLHHDARFLRSGEFVWSSEKTGYRHLYLQDADGGEIRPLTSGEWVVTSLVRVDQDRRVVYFSGTRESVLERHLYAVSLDGGEVRRLTPEPGWHSTAVSEDGAWFVDTLSGLSRAPVVSLRSTADGQPTLLFDNGGCSGESLGLRPPELATFSADDGTLLHGAIYWPPRREAGTRCPLVVSVYGGPHAQRVADEWSLTVDLRAQYLAQQGFAVLKLDNRGSANRGLAFEAHLDRCMGTVEVDDQVAAVRQLAGRGLIDPERVGIYGWSYGGYATCLALMRAPDVFRVGVAGAPVTDWDGYDTGYTERYMGTPEENPDGYREGSVLFHVDALKGKLLLVHGMVDENVQFRHTARLMVALANAQKTYDLLVFPEERHMPRDAKGLEYQERRVLGYFIQNL